jgi:hypothetical protein
MAACIEAPVPSTSIILEDHAGNGASSNRHEITTMAKFFTFIVPPIQHPEVSDYLTDFLSNFDASR